MLKDSNPSRLPQLQRYAAQWRKPWRVGSRGGRASRTTTFGSRVRTLMTEGAYECRGRERVPDAKLSEHGRANALDLRGLTLANGTRVDFTEKKPGS